MEKRRKRNDTEKKTEDRGMRENKKNDGRKMLRRKFAGKSIRDDDMHGRLRQTGRYEAVLAEYTCRPSTSASSAAGCSVGRESEAGRTAHASLSDGTLSRKTKGREDGRGQTEDRKTEQKTDSRRRIAVVC